MDERVHAANVVMLPGLGADERLFHRQREVLPNLRVPGWIEPEPDESLEHYAQRMAEFIAPQSPVFIGGCSMGGMIAMEITRHLTPTPRAVFLIGSGRSGQNAAKSLRMLRPLVNIAPRVVLATGKFVTRCTLPIWRSAVPDARLLMTMGEQLSPGFFHWACNAIVRWSFAGELPMPVFHIHGSHDRFIPLRNVQADRVVQGGGHFISLSHAKQVNGYLIEKMASLSHPAS